MNFEAPNNKFDNKQILKTLEKIIFKLDKENIDFSVEQTMNLYVSNLPISFNNVISTLIYSAIKSNFEEYKTYINYLRLIQENEEKLCCSNPKMIDMFVSFITEKKTNESIFLVINMIEENIIDASKIKKQFSLGLSNYNKLDKEGVNPSEIAKIIRNDEIEKLQEISSQNDFDFNQTIEPSLYERCSFINNWKVTLIDYAAFFGSVKCFKFLLMNGAKVENTGKYAIAGGNEKIIHLCEQNHSTFEDAYETAIKFHRNDIFKYLYENKFGNIDNNLLCSCVTNGNYEIFSFLEGKGMKIDEKTINETAKIGNLFLFKYLIEKSVIPKEILFLAVQSGNIELVKYILEQKGIDINAKAKYGMTALIKISYIGNAEIAKLLLEQKGIDVNAKDIYFGNTALMLAADYGNTEIVKLLLKQKGIDINTKDNFGKTALMYASENGHTDIVELLHE